MKIGELSQRTGASPRAIRHYEAAKLIRSTRMPNGYREFDATQVNRVLVIRDLLASGLNLEAIATVAPCYGADGVPRHCAGATEVINSELARLDQLAARIAAARTRLESLKTAPGATPS